LAVTNFDTINGKIMGQHATAVDGAYFLDPLGSVVAAKVNKSAVVNTTYTPLGGGSAPAGVTFGWVGGWGYRRTNGPSGLDHVRRRHMPEQENRWFSLDPLWPLQLPYTYCFGDPLGYADPSGLDPWTRKPRKPHHIPYLPTRGGFGQGWMYGAYCGSDNIANPGWAILPQDPLDNCCLQHDRCLEAHYGAGRDQNCGHMCCDRTLIACAASVSIGWESIQLIIGMGIGDATTWDTYAGYCRCIPEMDWPGWVQVYWGNPDTDKPCGHNTKPPIAWPLPPLWPGWYQGKPEPPGRYMH
jgi:hypothetical protein